MSIIKRIRNVGILTPCLSADQSAAGESSDLHPREKRPAHWGWRGDGKMEGNRRRGGKEARRWDRRRGGRRGDDDKEMGVKKEEEMGGKEKGGTSQEQK